MISISPQTRAAAFRQTLVTIIPPKSQSDRTGFRNVAQWLARKVEAGDFNEHIFPVVIDFAHEAAGPGVRNPAALFMSLLKKELNYPN
ncbi:MAG: hypothetical protein JSW66_10750 [Phycisphaerales bacterium]|nr:MAG: hypothetical protein JSW66_10750 [Phycisphaerales bacterium]